MKKSWIILLVLGLLFCCQTLAEEIKDEEYVELADSGLQIWIPSSFQAVELPDPEGVLYAYEMTGGSGRAVIRRHTTGNSLEDVYDFLKRNRDSLISLDMAEYGGMPFVVWQMEVDSENVFRLFGRYETDNAYALEMTFNGMDDAAFAAVTAEMVKSIRQSTSSLEKSLLPADADIPGNDGAGASESFIYTLDEYDRANISSIPDLSTDIPGLWLMPASVDGHKLQYIDPTCIPENVSAMLLPSGCYLDTRKTVPHEILVYHYLDYDTIQLQEYEYYPDVSVKPGEMLLRGKMLRYPAGNDGFETLMQDYYLYPTSVNGTRIWHNISPESVTTYTCGEFTYYNMSPDTVNICRYVNDTIQKVQVPDTLDGMTVVSVSAFSGYGSAIDATRAKEITLPTTLRILGTNAIFSNALKSLKLPEGLEEIGDGSLGAEGLKKMNLPDSLRRIGSCFSNADIRDLTIPDGVEEIRYYAFGGLELKSLKLPTSLKEIPGKMCFGQDHLGKITIPAGVISIGFSAFEGCSALNKVIFEEGLEEIRARAFFGCKKLNSLVMPSTIRRIGAEAFKGCKGLQKVTFGANLEEIDPSAFEDGAKKLTIVAPKGSYAASFAVENGYTWKESK